MRAGESSLNSLAALAAASSLLLSAPVAAKWVEEQLVDESSGEIAALRIVSGEGGGDTGKVTVFCDRKEWGLTVEWEPAGVELLSEPSDSPELLALDAEYRIDDGEPKPFGMLIEKDGPPGASFIGNRTDIIFDFMSDVSYGSRLYMSAPSASGADGGAMVDVNLEKSDDVFALFGVKCVQMFTVPQLLNQ